MEDRNNNCTFGDAVEIYGGVLVFGITVGLLIMLANTLLAITILKSAELKKQVKKN